VPAVAVIQKGRVLYGITGCKVFVDDDTKEEENGIFEGQVKSVDNGRKNEGEDNSL